MKLTFKIDYNTGWGEALFLTGSVNELSDGVKMEPDENGRPSVTIELSPAKAVFGYRYELRRDNGTVRREWGPDRRLRLDARLTTALMLDHWQDVPTNKPFFASAFTEAVFRQPPTGREHSLRNAVLEIRVDAPMIPSDCTLAIAGNCTTLGNWRPASAPTMNSAAFPCWTVQLPIESLPERIEYKFVLLRRNDRSVVGWETGDNRVLTRPTVGANGAIVVSGLFFENPLEPWRGSGTAIPVFSLRSEKGFGVGEFLDLEPMIDWAAATGQSFIQLLPINDTTMTHRWTDSYPYTTNSTFALHPMYLRLGEMGRLKDAEAMTRFEVLRHRLNELPTVDYEQVNNAKLEYARMLFEQQGQAEMTSQQFKDFAEKNDYWLMPYAAWSVLRDRYGTADMHCWEEYATYSPERIERFIELNRRDVDFFRFLQYHLDKQLRRVKAYAQSKGVALKGDIPIGISRCSVDAWMHPELFDLDCSAGAPPDDFAVMGQNWGFPTYKWDVMARDDYRWWRNRLSKMAEYFSAYRIDHLLGFFRIWQIPTDAVHGLLGTFRPALPLTPEEMRDRYGFKFEKRHMTRPYITRESVAERLGYLADEALASYLEVLKDGHLALKRGYTTQRDIASRIGYGSGLSDHDRRLSEGLMSLIDDVLFIEDPVEKGKYHPRITPSGTAIYASLDKEQRQCFDNLYEDFYYHRHNEFWKEKALEKLPALIDCTKMLSCAEDLGMIPSCVPEVMDMLKILSLEIQRMPKRFGIPFGYPDEYPYLSVCSTSTHDMPGLRQWWEEDYERAQRFYREMLHHEGDAPREAEPQICREILLQNLAAKSMLCILPLQDWLSISPTLRRENPREEQINVPADPHHYWRYRMHLTLEQLLAADEFNAEVAAMAASRMEVVR